MDDLVEFLRARFDEDALWATEASRWDGGSAVAGGSHWHWVDPETDEVVSVNADLDEFVNGDRFRVSLRSREHRQREATGFNLPQFVIRETEEVPSAVGGHIARHDPARVLAEVEAKRRMLALHAPNERDKEQCVVCDYGTDSCGCMGMNGGWPCETIAILALPYASHPDYRPSWAPSA